MSTIRNRALVFSHGKHLQATSPSRNGSNRLGCNRSIISCQKVSRRGSKQGDLLWLWNPEETSPEVQNRGFSGPIKGMISCNYIYFFKKIYRPPSAAIFFLTYFYRIRHWDIMQLCKQEIGDEAAIQHWSIDESALWSQPTPYWSCVILCLMNWLSWGSMCL